MEALGVKEDASFDDIVAAKNRKLKAKGVDEAATEQAYDILLMRSLNRRQSGSVDAGVRFADVRGSSPSGGAGGGGGGASSVFGGGRVSSSSSSKGPLQQVSLPQLRLPELSAPSDLTFRGVRDALPSAAFAGLLLWGLLQASAGRPNGVDDAPLLQVGVALGLGAYLLRTERNLGLPSALGVSVGGLAVGATAGGLAQAWLRVDLAPLGPVHSPSALVALTSIAAIWATSAFVARR